METVDGQAKMDLDIRDEDSCRSRVEAIIAIEGNI
jgi:hypothetical protein